MPDDETFNENPLVYEDNQNSENDELMLEDDTTGNDTETETIRDDVSISVREHYQEEQKEEHLGGINARASVRGVNRTATDEYIETGIVDTNFKKYIEMRSKKLDQKITKEMIDQKSSDWTEVKFHTLSSWVNIASFYIKITEKCIVRYKTLLKANTILSMLLSTLAGTLGVLNLNATTYDFPVKLTFLFANFGLATFSSYIKIDQIQEKLELFIKLKQEWTSFSAALSSELVLPPNMRVSSVELINRFKSKFLDLLKVDAEFPRKYKELIKNEGYSLSQIIQTFVQQEDHRLKSRELDDIPKEEQSFWRKKKRQHELDIEKEHRRLYTDYDEIFRAFHKENKWKVKQKFPEAKPREVSNNLYEMYQNLFNQVYPNASELIQMQNLIEIANNDRTNLQVLIWQEYNLLITSSESASSCFIIHNWYKEHISYPERKPGIITKQLHNQFDNMPLNTKEMWEQKSLLHDVLKPVFISLGVESFLMFVSSSKNFLAKYKKLLYDQSWDLIIKDFKDTFSKLTDEEKTKLMSNFTNQRDMMQNQLQELYDKIDVCDRELKSWINSKWKLRLNKQFLALLKHYRTEYNMINNPFYKAVKYEGFDVVTMFPQYTFQTLLPAYV
jgi:hypothetical protein